MSYTASYIVNSSSAQGTTDFQFTFPYIKEEHIEVYLNYSKLTQGSGSTQYQVITNVSPKLIRLNTGTASANLRVEVRRNSSLGSPLVDYADGSTLTANDLDTSALQSLYIDQELKDNQGKTVSVDEDTGLPSLGESGTNLRLTKVADPTAAQDAATKNYVDTKQFTSSQIQDGTLVNADVNASAAIDGTKISPNFGSQNIVTSGTVDGRDVSADGSKLDGIETGATADQTNAEIRAAVEAASDSNVFTDADHSKLNAIEAGATADQTNAEIRAAVEAASDSNVFTDADHTKLNAIEANATADQTDAEIRAAVEAATDSNVFTDADHTKLNGIETAATADQTAAEIKTAYESNAQTNPLTDAEKAVIDGVTANTSELNKLDGVTASTAELNIVAGKTFKTSSGTLDTTSDTEIPSAKVIAAHVASSQTAIGGFVTIADEVSFPTTANMPANGVVVSINNAAGVVVNGSGVSTTGRTTDGTPATVTINGFPSSLNGETLAAGVGLMVTATSTSNTYSYHKILAAETDVKQLSDDINDFNARYRVASSAPGSSNDAGDMYFDTSANKMKVYNGTTNAWDDVASVGSFYVNTISSSSGTGGGSATFNGSAYRFTLSNAGTSAQQHIVSVNGVIQKPNSGTSQPSEGFALSGNDIIFSAAPASGSDFFIITSGSSVSIGTPSANSVNSSHIIDGSIVNGDISNSANIAGSKLADDSIPEAKLDVHNAPATGKFLRYTSSGMEWDDVPAGVGGANGVDFNDDVKARFGTGNDLEIYHSGTSSYIQDNGTGDLIIRASDQLKIQETDGGETMAVFNKDGAVELYFNNNKTVETTVNALHLTGNASESNVKFMTSDGTQRGWLGSTNGGVFYARDQGNNTIWSAANGGALDLYHNNSKKLETTSSGINVTGSINVNGTALSAAPEITATASGSIADEAAVYVKSDGNVEAITTVSPGGKITSTSGMGWNKIYGTTFDTVQNRILVWYRADSTDYLRVRVGTPSGTGPGFSISWGAETTIQASAIDNCKVCYLNGSNRHVAVWKRSGQNIRGRVIKVKDDGTLTIGDEMGSTGTLSTVHALEEHSDDGTKVFILYEESDSDYNANIFDVNTSTNALSLDNGRKVDVGSYNVYSATTDYIGSDYVVCSYFYRLNNTTWKQAIQFFQRGGTGIDVTVKSRYDVVSTGNPNRANICWNPDTERIILMYRIGEGDDNVLYYQNYKINTSIYYPQSAQSETVITDSSSALKHLSDNGLGLVYDKDEKHIYGIYKEGSDTKWIKFITTAGQDAASLGTPVVVDDSTTGDHNDFVYDENAKTSYWTSTNPDNYSNVGNAYHLSTNMSADNFIGFAEGAVTNGQTATIKVVGNTTTKSSLTPGKKYYVQKDGSLGLTAANPSVEAGVALSSTKLLIKG